MTSTTGRFDLTRWDEEVIDDAEGAKLVRVSNSKRFEEGEHTYTFDYELP